MFKTFLATHDLSEYTFRSDMFPTVEARDFWENFPFENCIGQAEAALDFAWPVIKASDFMEFLKSGNRVIMENPHFDRRHHLMLFTIAELMENKGRFLPQVVNGLFAICEETYWGLSAHVLNYRFEHPPIPSATVHNIDLNAAETAQNLVMATTLLKKPLENFCPLILDRVAYEIERRIKLPYETRFDFHWMGYAGGFINNWNVWILSNLLTVFLLTEEDGRRKTRAIRKMMLEAQHYFDAMPSDGGCDEGPIYWSMAGGCLFEFVYQLKQASKGALDLFANEKLGNIAAYMQKVHLTADRFANIADSHASGQSRTMPLLFAFGRQTKREELANFSAAIQQKYGNFSYEPPARLYSMRRAIYHVSFLKEMKTYKVSYPLHGALEYLPELQVAALHRGDFVLLAKGGYNAESHNHNDVGSFMLYDGSTPVLVDVGIGVYSRYTFSTLRYVKIPWVQGRNHNIPMVNGTEQKAGSVHRASAFSASEDRISVSFAGAYEEKAGLVSLDRTLRLTDTAATVCDRFAFASDARSVSEVLMCVLPVRIEGNTAIIGERYRVSSNVGTISCEFIPFEDTLLEEAWETKGVSRIVFHAENVEKITLTIEKI